MRPIPCAILIAAAYGCSNPSQVTQPHQQSAVTAAAVQYEVVKLPSIPGGTQARGMAINQQGWVAGWSNQADGTRRARALGLIPGMDERTATAIVMRALHWPDAFPSADPSLQRAAGVTGARALHQIAEPWRPWRGYAAAHLACSEELLLSLPPRFRSPHRDKAG